MAEEQTTSTPISTEQEYFNNENKIANEVTNSRLTGEGVTGTDSSQEIQDAYAVADMSGWDIAGDMLKGGIGGFLAGTVDTAAFASQLLGADNFAETLTSLSQSINALKAKSISEGGQAANRIIDEEIQKAELNNLLTYNQDLASGMSVGQAKAKRELSNALDTFKAYSNNGTASLSAGSQVVGESTGSIASAIVTGGATTLGAKAVAGGARLAFKAAGKEALANTLGNGFKAAGKFIADSAEKGNYLAKAANYAKANGKFAAMAGMQEGGGTYSEILHNEALNNATFEQLAENNPELIDKCNELIKEGYSEEEAKALAKQSFIKDFAESQAMFQAGLTGLMSLPGASITNAFGVRGTGFGNKALKEGFKSKLAGAAWESMVEEPVSNVSSTYLGNEAEAVLDKDKDLWEGTGRSAAEATIGMLPVGAASVVRATPKAVIDKVHERAYNHSIVKKDFDDEVAIRTPEERAADQARADKVGNITDNIYEAEEGAKEKAFNGFDSEEDIEDAVEKKPEEKKMFLPDKSTGTKIRNMRTVTAEDADALDNIYFGEMDESLSPEEQAKQKAERKSPIDYRGETNKAKVLSELKEKIGQTEDVNERYKLEKMYNYLVDTIPNITSDEATKFFNREEFNELSDEDKAKTIKEVITYSRFKEFSGANTYKNADKLHEQTIKDQATISNNIDKNVDALSDEDIKNGKRIGKDDSNNATDILYEKTFDNNNVEGIINDEGQLNRIDKTLKAIDPNTLSKANKQKYNHLQKRARMLRALSSMQKGLQKASGKTITQDQTDTTSDVVKTSRKAKKDQEERKRVSGVADPRPYFDMQNRFNKAVREGNIQEANRIYKQVVGLVTNQGIKINAADRAKKHSTEKGTKSSSAFYRPIGSKSSRKVYSTFKLGKLPKTEVEHTEEVDKDPRYHINYNSNGSSATLNTEIAAEQIMGTYILDEMAETAKEAGLDINTNPSLWAEEEKGKKENEGTYAKNIAEKTNNIISNNKDLNFLNNDLLNTFKAKLEGTFKEDNTSVPPSSEGSNNGSSEAVNKYKEDVSKVKEENKDKISQEKIQEQQKKLEARKKEVRGALDKLKAQTKEVRATAKKLATQAAPTNAIGLNVNRLDSETATEIADNMDNAINRIEKSLENINDLDAIEEVLAETSANEESVNRFNKQMDEASKNYDNAGTTELFKQTFTASANEIANLLFRSENLEDFYASLEAKYGKEFAEKCRYVLNDNPDKDTKEPTLDGLRELLNKAFAPQGTFKLVPILDNAATLFNKHLKNNKENLQDKFTQKDKDSSNLRAETAFTMFFNFSTRKSQKGNDITVANWKTPQMERLAKLATMQWVLSQAQRAINKPVVIGEETTDRYIVAEKDALRDLAKTLQNFMGITCNDNGYPVIFNSAFNGLASQIYAGMIKDAKAKNSLIQDFKVKSSDKIFTKNAKATKVALIPNGISNQYVDGYDNNNNENKIEETNVISFNPDFYKNLTTKANKDLANNIKETIINTKDTSSVYITNKDKTDAMDMRFTLLHTNTPITSDQILTNIIANNSDYTYNQRMGNIFDALGDNLDSFLIDNYDPEVMTDRSRISLNGQKETYKAFKEDQQDFKDRCTQLVKEEHPEYDKLKKEEQNKLVKDKMNSVKRHYNHVFTSVSRLMQVGTHNPQSNKIIRELFMPTESNLNLASNEQHQDIYRRAILQGLGISVQKELPEKITSLFNDVLDVLNDPKNKNAVDLIAKATNGESVEGADLKTAFNQIQNALIAKKIGITPRTAIFLHNISDLIRYNNTKDKSNFNTFVYIETDGITDGLSNLISLFTPHTDKEFLTNQARTGIFFGMAGNYADIYSVLGLDSYAYNGKKATDTLLAQTDGIIESLAHYISTKLVTDSTMDRNILPSDRKKADYILRQFFILGEKAGLVAFDEELKKKDINSVPLKEIIAHSFTRNGMKKLVTGAQYGGGVHSIMEGLEDSPYTGFADKINDQLNKFLKARAKYNKLENPTKEDWEEFTKAAKEYNETAKAVNAITKDFNDSNYAPLPLITKNNMNNKDVIRAIKVYDFNDGAGRFTDMFKHRFKAQGAEEATPSLFTAINDGITAATGIANDEEGYNNARLSMRNTSNVLGALANIFINDQYNPIEKEEQEYLTKKQAKESALASRKGIRPISNGQVKVSYIQTTKAKNDDNPSSVATRRGGKKDGEKSINTSEEDYVLSKVGISMLGPMTMGFGDATMMLNNVLRGLQGLPVYDGFNTPLGSSNTAFYENNNNHFNAVYGNNAYTKVLNTIDSFLANEEKRYKDNPEKVKQIKALRDMLKERNEDFPRAFIEDYLLKTYTDKYQTGRFIKDRDGKFERDINGNKIPEEASILYKDIPDVNDSFDLAVSLTLLMNYEKQVNNRNQALSELININDDHMGGSNASTNVNNKGLLPTLDFSNSSLNLDEQKLIYKEFNEKLAALLKAREDSIAEGKTLEQFKEEYKEQIDYLNNFIETSNKALREGQKLTPKQEVIEEPPSSTVFVDNIIENPVQKVIDTLASFSLEKAILKPLTSLFNEKILNVALKGVTVHYVNRAKFNSLSGDNNANGFVKGKDIYICTEYSLGTKMEGKPRLEVSTDRTLAHEALHLIFNNICKGKIGGNNVSSTVQTSLVAIDSVIKDMIKHIKDLPEGRVKTIATYLSSIKDPYERRQEFIAWSLTDNDFAKFLKRNSTSINIDDAIYNTEDTSLSNLINRAKRILTDFFKALANMFSKLLGKDLSKAEINDDMIKNIFAWSGKNVPSLYTVLDRALTHKKVIEHLENPTNDIVSDNLFQKAFNTTNTDHADLFRNLADLIHNATININSVVPEVLKNIYPGYSQDIAEAITHTKAVFEAGLKLNQSAFNTLNNLFINAQNRLTYKDLLSDPNNATADELLEAQNKYDYLLGTKSDLGNFVSMALLDPAVSNALNKLNLLKEDPSREDNKVESFLGSILNGIFNTLNRIVSGTISGNTETIISKMFSNILGSLQGNNTKFSPLSMGEEALQKAENITRKAVATATEYVGGAIEKTGEVIGDNAVGATLNNAGKAIRQTGQFILPAYLAHAERVVPDYDSPLIQMFTSVASKWDKHTILSEVLRDIVGTTLGALGLSTLAKQVKNVEATRTKTIRDMVSFLQEAFDNKLTEQDWVNLNALQKADITALSSLSFNELQEILSNNAALQRKITQLRSKIGNLDPKATKWILDKCEKLAKYMMTGEVSSNMRFNADAIACKVGTKVFNPNASQDLINAIDELTTLMAIQQMNPKEKATINTLFKTNGKAMAQTLGIMYSIKQQDKEGVDSYSKIRFNAIKGFSQRSDINTHEITIAPIAERKNLESLGWEYVEPYQMSSKESGKVPSAYYIKKHKVEAVFNKGVLQKARPHYAGIDAVSGLTIVDNIASEDIYSYQTIQNLHSQGNETGQPLIATYDDNGRIITIQRSISSKVYAMSGKPTRLDYSLARHEGRNVEQALGEELVDKSIDYMRDTYQKIVNDANSSDPLVAKQAKKELSMYVDLKDYVSTYNSKLDTYVKGPKYDPIVDDAFQLLSKKTKQEITSLGMKVRADQISTWIGERQASVLDLRTGNSRLSNTAQTTLNYLTKLCFGNLPSYITKNGDPDRYIYNAYRFEKGTQEIVSYAKRVVVALSMVVPMQNFQNNLIQLNIRGVPLRVIVSQFIKKTKECHDYVKYMNLRAKLELQNRDQTLSDAQRKLNQSKIDRIDSYIKKMSIYPLIQYGELNTIVEDLNDIYQEDDSFLLGRFENLFNKAVDALPKEVIALGKNMVMSRDSKMFNIISNTVAYSDFIAKSIYYDHLKEQQVKDLNKGQKPMQENQILQKVRNEFVNYDMKMGRTRQYLESLGLMWFYNFKLRMARVAVENMIENPLKTVLYNGILPNTGYGTPLSDSIIGTIANPSKFFYSMNPFTTISNIGMHPLFWLFG